MRIIGFNFTKINAEKLSAFKAGMGKSTNVEFEDIVKEESDLGKGDTETLKATFKFSLTYSEADKKESKSGEVILSGFVMLLASKEDSKDLQKAWKKKEISDTFRIPIFNFILKRCTVRALQLEEELNLPLHLPLPQLRAEPKKQ